MPAKATPWLLTAASAAFAGLWALLLYCDVFQIQPLGWRLESGDAGRLVVRAVDAGSPAEAAGVRAGDELLSANGWPMASRLDVTAMDANVRAGAPLRLELRRDGANMAAAIDIGAASWRYTLTPHGAALMLTRAVQLVTLGIAVLIAFRRPRTLPAIAAAWMLATAAVTSITLPSRFASTWRGLPDVVAALLFVAFISRAAIGGAIFVFFTVFPRRTLTTRKLVLALVPIGAVLAWEATFAWRVLFEQPGAWPLERALPLILAINVTYAAAGLGAAATGYRRLTDVTERRRVRVVLSGAFTASLSGSLVFLYYWTSDSVHIGRPIMSLLPVMAGTLLLLVLPLSFAYAILRHRLFDVSVIVRRGVQYTLARGVLALVVPALIAILTAEVFWNGKAGVLASLRDRGWTYLVVGLAVVVAHLRRRRWLNALDRRFFRERYSAQRLLREITSDLRAYAGQAESSASGRDAQAGDERQRNPTSGPRDPADVVARVVAKIHQALHPESAAVLVRNALNGRFEPLAGAEATPLHLSDDSKLVSIARVLQKPLETPASGTGGLASALPGEERDALRNARVELIVPVVAAGGQMEMLLALGPRRSEEPYSAEDVDLLAAVADGLAMTLDRAAPGGVTSGGIGAGRCLAGRYRIEGPLGEGGMGTVYAAVDLALERDVAVKLVREDLVASPAARDRFQRETRIAASFTHPNIVTVHDYGVIPGGRAFIVMERLRGETLAERIGRDGGLEPCAALRILREVADAIEVAHARDLVHRDLKPSNIFLVRDDSGERAKVLDFGIAKFLAGDSSAATTSAGAIIGTPRYMAPEQLRGEEPSTRWDVWALTMIAFEMLTGQRAFDGAASAQPGALESARPEWRPFFDRALSFHAEQRPAAARALVEGLARTLAHTAQPMST